MEESFCLIIFLSIRDKLPRFSPKKNKRILLRVTNQLYGHTATMVTSIKTNTKEIFAVIKYEVYLAPKFFPKVKALDAGIKVKLFLNVFSK